MNEQTDLKWRSEFHKALSNPVRLQIVEMVLDGEMANVISSLQLVIHNLRYLCIFHSLFALEFSLSDGMEPGSCIAFHIRE